MQNIRILLVVSALIVAGCGSKDSDKQIPIAPQSCVPESKLLSSGIVGGTKVTQGDPDSKKVMMLYNDGELCTASALTKHILITAAHCVQKSAAKSWVAFHESLSCESGFKVENNAVPVVEFVVHPDYKKIGEANPNDLALIILRDAIPVGYQTYGIADPDDLTANSTLYFYGYGDVNYKQGGAGILRKTQVSRQNYSIESEQNLVSVDQTIGHGVCNGDSGGPSLVNINGEMKLLGVNSYVGGPSEASLCDGKGYLTLVNSFKTWIQTEVALRGENLKN
jgi:secreted trypsin-like serine protease